MATDPDPESPTPIGDAIKAAFGDPQKKQKAPKKVTVTAAEPFGFVAGMPVMAKGLKQTKAGDGLSTAMTVAGLSHDIGDRFYVLNLVEVRKVEYERLPKGVEGLREVEVVDVITPTIVDGKWAEKAVKEQEKANREAEEAARGLLQLEEVDGAKPMADV